MPIFLTYIVNYSIFSIDIYIWRDYMSDTITTTNAKAKRERFVRIAEKRVNNILDLLDRLANCANKRNYKYSENDVKLIFSEIEKKVKDARGKFQETSDNKSRFKLKNNITHEAIKEKTHST